MIALGFIDSATFLPMSLLPTPSDENLQPTDAEPGTRTKLEVFRQRYEAGQSLHVGGDQTIDYVQRADDPDWRLRYGYF